MPRRPLRRCAFRAAGHIHYALQRWFRRVIPPRWGGGDMLIRRRDYTAWSFHFFRRADVARILPAARQAAMKFTLAARGHSRAKFPQNTSASQTYRRPAFTDVSTARERKAAAPSYAAAAFSARRAFR